MKTSTIVLTITALTTTLVGRPAQALPPSPPGYNQAYASAALAATPTTLEQGLMTAINAQRAANGVPALTWDTGLAAAARYQEDFNNSLNFYGENGFLADGKTPVYAQQMAAAFGSQATGVAEGMTSSVYHPADFGNPAAMVADWKPLDQGFAAMLSSAAPDACGISVVARYNSRSNTTTYQWAILFGTSPAATPPPTTTTPPPTTTTPPPTTTTPPPTTTTPPPTTTTPPPTTTTPPPTTTQVPAGYSVAFATLALQAAPTTLEQGLMTAINAQRAANGVPALTWDTGLAAAARYQEDFNNSLNFYGENGFLADGKTPVYAQQMAAAFGSQATGVAEGMTSSVYHPADFGNPAAMVADWKPLDQGFAAMLSSAAPDACGISVVARYNSRSNTTTYQWAILFGTSPAATPPPTTTPPPTSSLSSLNAALAAAAQTATASADETSLLATINSYRSYLGGGPLTPDAGLTAAAQYQASDDLALGRISLFPTWAYQADANTQVTAATLASDFASPAVNVNDYVFSNDWNNGAYLSQTPSGWGRQLTMWKYHDAAGFGAMLSSGAYNSCGIAVIGDGNATQNGVSYPVKYYVLIVGRK